MAAPLLPLLPRSALTTQPLADDKEHTMSRHHNARAQTAARALLAPVVAAGAATCPKCQKPIRPDDEWDAGHETDLALGGHVAGRVHAEHTSCNRAAGARLGAQLRPRGRRRLAAWLEP